MHILFVHKNFPAQFGQVAAYLARHHGYQCTFVSERDVASTQEIRHIQYATTGGARETTHYCSRTFENQTWHSYAVFERLKGMPEIKPDLIVCHSGFVSSLFLRELYPDVPHIGYFELFYHVHGGDLDYRSDLPLPPVNDYLRARNRNAQLLLDLNHVDAGYCPTAFQRSTLPEQYQSKLHTIFDGLDADFWNPKHQAPGDQRSFGGVTIPKHHKLLTYVSRGFESMRGSDIFLRAAAGICKQRSDVSVMVIGEEQQAYGGDTRFTEGKSFRQWTIDQYQIELTNIHFVGRIPPRELSALLATSDLHVYLTVPFTLSWSLFNALSCGCTVLASDTAPVRDIIRDQHTGLLVDFFDVEAFTERALEVLESPEDYRNLGDAGRQLILENYTLPVCLEKMQKFYADTAAQRQRNHDATS